MAKVVPLLFDGKASDFFDNLSEDKKEDFDELKAAVIQHFQCNKSKLRTVGTAKNHISPEQGADY